MASAGMLAPLRVASFRYQFAARTVSMLGSTLSPVALSLGTLQVTGSATAFSLVLAAFSLPQLVFLLVGGVIADRLPRNRVMAVAAVVRGGTQAAMGLMLVTGAFELWVAVPLQLLAGTAAAFHYPASSGLTAQTVPKELLQPANALLSLVRNVSGTVGPLVAAVLVSVDAAGWALLADGVSYLASAVLLSRLKLESSAGRSGARQRRFRRELAEGWREVTGRSWVWTSIVVFMFAHLSAAFFAVLGPVMLVERGAPALLWGAVIAATSIGEILGNLLAIWVIPRRPMLTARLVELLSVPVLFALALGAPGWLLVVTAVPAGIAVTFTDTLWLTSMQQHLPVDVLSRVSSFDWLGSTALRPAGYLGAAVLAGLLGGASAIAIAAVLVTATSLAGLLFSDVRRLTSVEPSRATSLESAGS